MDKEYGRGVRIAAQMQKELAFVLQREIDDSRLGFITINEVLLDNNLSTAEIYITVLNASEKDKIKNINVLNKLSPVIRHQVAKRMSLRRICKFKFYYNYSFDRGTRIAELLANLSQK